LENIYKELSTDVDGFAHPGHGDLSGWAKQGEPSPAEYILFHFYTQPTFNVLKTNHSTKSINSSYNVTLDTVHKFKKQNKTIQPHHPVI
jgi:hypothetical protein